MAHTTDGGRLGHGGTFRLFAFPVFDTSVRIVMQWTKASDCPRAGAQGEFRDVEMRG